MPGLPRKSTVKQFRRLMKKSGKAKTNKAAGGSDPSSRKIATYEQFCLMREAIDPYGEEDWEESWIGEVKDFYDLAYNQIDWNSINYELLFTKDPVAIELLRDENGELVEDDDFYFGLFFNNLEEVSLKVRYLRPTGQPGTPWHKSTFNGEVNINDRYGKISIFKKLKKVINSIKYHHD
jgi:hypothetical protein